MVTNMHICGGRIVFAMLAIATLAACSDTGEGAGAPGPSYDMVALKGDARAAIKDFGPALKAELLEAMSTGGTVAAIEVCHLRAPDIAAATGGRHRLQIGRTSHRVRNPANAPDEWEAARLQEFLVAVAQGVAAETLDFGAVVDTDEGPVFRYMKAIPTDSLCVVCHGQGLAPEVIEALDRLYPEDQARDFRTGDLRGAFTVTRKLN